MTRLNDKIKGMILDLAVETLRCADNTTVELAADIHMFIEKWVDKRKRHRKSIWRTLCKAKTKAEEKEG